MVDLEKCESLMLGFLEFEKNLEEQFKTEILEPFKACKARQKRQRRLKRNNVRKNQPPAASNEAGFSAMPSIAEEGSGGEVLHVVRSSQRSAAKKASVLVSKQLQQSLLEKLRNPDTGTKKKRAESSSTSSAAPLPQAPVTSAPSVSGLNSECTKEKVALLDCVVMLNRCDDLVKGGSPEKAVEAVCDRPSTKICRILSPVASSPADGETKDHGKDVTACKSPKRTAETMDDNELSRKRSKTSNELFTETAESQPCENGILTVDDLTKKTETSSNPLVIDNFKVPYVVLDKSASLNLMLKKHTGLSLQSSGGKSGSETIEGVSDSGVLSRDEGTSDAQPSVEEPPGLKLDGEKHNEVNSVEPDVSKNDKNSAKESEPPTSQGAENATFVVPEPSRPVRIRTKNRKYDDSFVDETLFVKKKKTTRSKQVEVPNVSGPSVVNETSSSSESPSSKRAAKRKSDSEESNSNKSMKLNDRQKDVEEDKSVESSAPSGKSTSSHSVASDRSDQVKSSSGDSSPVSRSRTKTITKPVVKNPIVIDQVVSSTSTCSSEIVDDRDFVVNTPKPEPRMTRTRTKEIKNNQAKLPVISSTVKINSSTKSGNKENQDARVLKMLCLSEKSVRGTPLATNNTLFSPPRVDLSQKKLVPSSLSKGLNKDASIKKKEMMLAQSEGVKRKREEREKRIQAHKLALEAKNLEKRAKLLKEKEEKERQVALAKRLKEEQILQKKQMNEVLIKEAEERRLKEEEAKQARIRKQEEEKRKLAEERIKMAEDAKRQYEMRLAQEAKGKELSTKEKEIKKVTNKQMAAVSTTSYNLTPHKSEIEPKLPKNKDNYGLSDADSGDSTDDEKQPKKLIPKWATKSERRKNLIYQFYIHQDFEDIFFCSSELEMLKMFSARCRPRASSATWDTPESSNSH